MTTSGARTSSNLNIYRDCGREHRSCPLYAKNATCRPAVLFRDKMEDRRPHLLWVANTLLACPRPLQPGKGQWGSSCLLAFQAKGSPLMDDSFCLLAASGQLPALRWDVYFPDIWPCPSHPITGHLPDKQTKSRTRFEPAHTVVSHGGKKQTNLHLYAADKTETFNWT